MQRPREPSKQFINTWRDSSQRRHKRQMFGQPNLLNALRFSFLHIPTPTFPSIVGLLGACVKRNMLLG